MSPPRAESLPCTVADANVCDEEGLRILKVIATAEGGQETCFRCAQTEDMVCTDDEGGVVVDGYEA